MTTIYTLATAPDHHFHDHPERPARLELLQLAGLPGCVELPFQPASLEALRRVHSAAMIASLEQACLRGPGIIDHAPTYVTPASYVAACLAAGAALSALRAVLDGTARNGFAIVRPPGHHAEPARAMGFCLFNNAAIVAQDALAHGLKRVAVVDFDVHHGNGTQAAFLRDSRAAYLSTHQEGIYPGTGWLEDADSPDLRGRLVNLPLPPGTGDEGFRQILAQVVSPFVRSFQPELLIISAGYDAHWRDPLAGLGLSSAGIGRLSQGLVDLAEENCRGRILFLLEGGYEARNVANGIRAGLCALTGHPQPEVDDACPWCEPELDSRLARAREWHGFK